MARPALLTFLHDDDACVAVVKPAGLAVIPGRAETTSLLEELATQLGLPCTGTGDPRVRVVHRLDKETSGVVLFAKTIEAQRHFSHQFQNNMASKEYLALVAGSPAGGDGVVENQLGPHPTDKLRMAVVKRGGRPAVTAWKVEQRFKRFTLVRCFPRTGKTHQIRVHLAHIGLPLAIDPLYNRAGPRRLMLSELKRGYRPAGGREERPLIERLTLHAEQLTVFHPDGRTLVSHAEMPKDFRSTVSQLGRV